MAESGIVWWVERRLLSSTRSCTCCVALHLAHPHTCFLGSIVVPFNSLKSVAPALKALKVGAATGCNEHLAAPHTFAIVQAVIDSDCPSTTVLEPVGLPWVVGVTSRPREARWLRRGGGAQSWKWEEERRPLHALNPLRMEPRYDFPSCAAQCAAHPCTPNAPRTMVVHVLFVGWFLWRHTWTPAFPRGTGRATMDQ